MRQSLTVCSGLPDGSWLGVHQDWVKRRRGGHASGGNLAAKIASPLVVRQNNPVLDTLATAFKAFGDCQPLAIGIHKVIKERLPDMDMKQLRAALRMHTASTRYLKAMSQASTRFDLDGLHTGEVTVEQRQQALDTLRERFRKRSERRKAEQLANQQQEKLRLLAEKFNVR